MSATHTHLGNAAYVDEDFEAAIGYYSKAIAAHPEDADAFSKRAAAHLRLKRFTEAVSDATVSIKLQVTRMALSRKGQASFALGEYEAAKASFSRAIDLCASQDVPTDLRRWVRKCDAEIALASTTNPSGQSPAVANPAAPVHSAAAPPTTTSDPSKIRHEWYQTQSEVVISILARNVPKEHVSIDFAEAEVDATIKLDSGAEFVHCFNLFHKIVPTQSSYSVSTAKIELKLKKHTAGKWDALEGSGDANVSAVALNAVPDTALQPASKKVYSGSSKDWDSIETRLKKEEVGCDSASPSLTCPCGTNVQAHHSFSALARRTRSLKVKRPLTSFSGTFTAVPMKQHAVL